MLVLKRSVGEGIVIADGITVTVMMVSGQRVRLGIEAPASVQVSRLEQHGGVSDHSAVSSTDPPAGAAELAAVLPEANSVSLEVEMGQALS